jgi:hypothetical protein
MAQMSGLTPQAFLYSTTYTTKLFNLLFNNISGGLPKIHTILCVSGDPSKIALNEQGEYS